MTFLTFLNRYFDKIAKKGYITFHQSYYCPYLISFIIKNF
jgi:hypothetical protein